ncbi:hypothetical protein JCM3774_002765 [Rhodotorula dairenensis]
MAAPAPASALSVLSFGSASHSPPAASLLPPGLAARDPEPDLAHVARTVLKAKRVAVVCGAGISTASGIPDFRSGAGLFESLKKQYPDAKLSTGKDLFDVGLFASETNAAIFFNMIAELKKQTDAVRPTAFHEWLKQLDDDGKLFRVYTQNIDALEEKAGLTYGLGDKSLPLPPRRKGTAAPSARSPSKSSTASSAATPVSSSVPLEPTLSQASVTSSLSSISAAEPTPRSSQSPPPPPPPPPPTHSAIPRVIPLHGHLSTLSCPACKHQVPLAGEYVDLLASGTAPTCPACLSIETARSAAGGRSRGVGIMRPDVVLYGEEHKDGDRVGEITHRDLMGQRPDLLIVVGTTLKVKGTKRLVRELAKVIRPVAASTTAATASSSGRDDDHDDDDGSSSATSPSKSSSQPQAQPRRRPPPRPRPIHTLYLNYDFPTPSKEWAGVFDCWLRGDIQEFVEAVKREQEVMKQEAEGRERRRLDNKRKRQHKEEEEDDLARTGPGPSTTSSTASSSSTSGARRSGGPHASKRAASVANAIKGKGRGSPAANQRKSLVPARNAQPPVPSSLRPPPVPSRPTSTTAAAPAVLSPVGSLARTDPNKRTRSSLHHALLPSPTPALEGAPAAATAPMSTTTTTNLAAPLVTVTSSTPFAPVSAEQHYRQPYQLPSLSLGSLVGPPATSTSAPGLGPGSFAPFTQVASHAYTHHPGLSLSLSLAGVQSLAAVPWNVLPPIPSLNSSTASVSLSPPSSSSSSSTGTAPFSTEPERERLPRGEEQLVVTATSTMSSLPSSRVVRRVDSSSSLSSLSEDDEDEEEEEEEEEEMVKITKKGTTADLKRRGKQPRLPLLKPSPLAPLPSRSRRSTATRSSTLGSGSSSDSSQGLTRLAVASPAPPAAAATASSTSSTIASKLVRPPPSPVPTRRRSSRSSTASSTHASREQDAARRRLAVRSRSPTGTGSGSGSRSGSGSGSGSSSEVTAAALVAARSSSTRRQTRSSVTPPGAVPHRVLNRDKDKSKNTVKGEKAAATATTHELGFKVTKASVAGVTGTAPRKRRERAA